MRPVSMLRQSVSRIVAGAFVAALLGLGAAPALADPIFALEKTGEPDQVTSGSNVTFKITIKNTGTGSFSHLVDELPVFPGSDWKILPDLEDDLMGCNALLEPDGQNPQILTCDANSLNGTQGAHEISVTVQSPTRPNACLQLTNIAELYSSAVAHEAGQDPITTATGTITVTGDTCRPLFVIGDVEPHAVGDVVNFWGSQWWKNNFMSGFVSKGVASFKGYASDSDIFCGEGAMWESRVGNSPPPPATIPDDVLVIVTDTVYKDGPDIVGSIKQILLVHSDGKYGPNPGHRGGGEVKAVLCPTQF